MLSISKNISVLPVVQLNSFEVFHIARVPWPCRGRITPIQSRFPRGHLFLGTKTSLHRNAFPRDRYKMHAS